MLKKLEMLKEKVAAYCFGDSGLKLKANAPPTIPKIAPTKNPPIPKKLMAENTIITVPQIKCSPGCARSITALITIMMPESKPTIETPAIKLYELA
ncbi:hypothetical protein IMZ68_00890 [Candidatus Bathyarchaeota archaeon]|nr:hypothetical protein [Candidatus Bathyarchaeota archaeon]